MTLCRKTSSLTAFFSPRLSHTHTHTHTQSLHIFLVVFLSVWTFIISPQFIFLFFFHFHSCNLDNFVQTRMKTSPASMIGACCMICCLRIKQSSCELTAVWHHTALSPDAVITVFIRHEHFCLSFMDMYQTCAVLMWLNTDLIWLTDGLFTAGLAVGLDPEGYGNPDFCWISISDKLIWSFAGPIVIVILVTVLLVICSGLVTDCVYSLELSVLSMFFYYMMLRWVMFFSCTAFSTLILFHLFILVPGTTNCSTDVAEKALRMLSNHLYWSS